jgi:hypothetical protein
VIELLDLTNSSWTDRLSGGRELRKMNLQYCWQLMPVMSHKLQLTSERNDLFASGSSDMKGRGERVWYSMGGDAGRENICEESMDGIRVRKCRKR